MIKHYTLTLADENGTVIDQFDVVYGPEVDVAPSGTVDELQYDLVVYPSDTIASAVGASLANAIKRIQK